MTHPRNTVRDYLAATGWSIPQFLRAVRMGNTSDVVSERSCRDWLHGIEINRHAQNGMVRFIADWPNPGAFTTWEHNLAAKGRQRALDEEQAMQARRDAVQRNRAEQVAALLAAECAGRKPSRPWFPSQRFLSTSTSRNNPGQAGRESGLAGGRL